LRKRQLPILKLHTSTNPDKQNLNDYVYRIKIESKVKQEDMNVCDGQLSVEECTEAIFKMKLNKSPGIDGLTVEFYRTFWESIKYLIVFILNKCHEDRQLSFSQRTSVLTLLFKNESSTLKHQPLETCRHEQYRSNHPNTPHLA
jgi:hypothetical protein